MRKTCVLRHFTKFRGKKQPFFTSDNIQPKTEDIKTGDKDILVTRHIYGMELLLALSCRVEEEFIHLLLVDVRRRVDHNVAALVVLRECDVVADCLLSTEE